MAEQKITKDMIIADILKVDENLIPVLLNAGMHCVGSHHLWERHWRRRQRFTESMLMSFVSFLMSLLLNVIYLKRTVTISATVLFLLLTIFNKELLGQYHVLSINDINGFCFN